MFPLFCKRVTWDSTYDGVIFRSLVRGCSFPVCWRIADVVPVRRGSSSSDVGDNRLISITVVMSKVFEKIVAGKLNIFLEETGLLPLQFSYVGA